HQRPVVQLHGAQEASAYLGHRERVACPRQPDVVLIARRQARVDQGVQADRVTLLNHRQYDRTLRQRELLVVGYLQLVFVDRDTAHGSSPCTGYPVLSASSTSSRQAMTSSLGPRKT